MSKKILLLGGTGAIGVYLIPELLNRGFTVFVTSRKMRSSDKKSLKYIHGDARDNEFLSGLLQREKYDVIVDFMVYSTAEFKDRYKLLLKSCKQYMFLSSYRVFADNSIITESSPRLLDVLTDTAYLATDDYALTKARQEDILRSSKHNNWTIVRPSITYSRERFQFGTLEANVIVWRALHNLPVILPRLMQDRITTMTWAGDTARLMAKLVLNKKSFADDFNIGTSEYHTWAEIAQIYRETIGMKVKLVELDEYIKASGYEGVEYLVKYNRLYDRIMDSKKVLSVTGETQKDFVKLNYGLRIELSRFRKNPNFGDVDYAKHARIDKLTHSALKLQLIPKQHLRTYLKNRYPSMASLALFARRIGPRTRLKKVSLSLKRSLRIRTRIRGLRSRLISQRNIAQLKKINDAPEGAILTLIDYSNYGNILQRFALQRFLFKSGHNFTSYEHPFPRNSDVTQERYANISDFIYRYVARKKFNENDNFSAYIVGSDQVWRNWGYGNEDNELGFFFFNFVRDPQKKLIAYAVSFGKENSKSAGISRRFMHKVKPHVRNISFLSVREKSGAAIIKHEWGVESEITIDPTMLLEAQDYDRIIRESSDKGTDVAGVFAYILVTDRQKVELVKNVARLLHESPYSIYPYEQEGLPSVAFWLKSVRDANLVVTDSFHCVVFSMIFNTEFLVVENDVGGIARIIDLLRVFGLEDRLISSEKNSRFDLKKIEPINWDTVNNKMSGLREASSDWLMHAIENEHERDNE